MKNYFKFYIVVLIFAFCVLYSSVASAYQITNVVGDKSDNFSVYPNRFDLRLTSGKDEIKEVVVTNHSGEELFFSVRTEDFIGETGQEGGVKFLGESSGGKFSFKNYLKSEINNFTLKSGEQISFNVLIKLPVDFKTSNGLYAALMLTAKSVKNDSAISSFSRAAVLFLARTDENNLSPVSSKKEGETSFDFVAFNQGALKMSMPQFKLIFGNNGGYHLALLGSLKIYDWRREEASNVDLDFWYVLPETKSEKIVTVPQKLFFGKYTAEAELIWKDPITGAEKKEIKKINFWVLPEYFWMIMGAFILLLLILIFIGLFRDSRLSRRISVLLLISLLTLFGRQSVFANLESENYKIIREVIDVGGTDRARSDNYQMTDTSGQTAAGNLASDNYNLKAGFRTPDVYALSISTPSDVTISGCTQGVACVSSGTISWTVTTSNPSGYTLSLSASTAPALKSGSNYFNDYSSSQSLWSVENNTRAFGFAIGETGETNIVTAFKDNGASCGTGSNIGSCYRGFNGTDSIQITSRGSAASSGNITTVKLKAEVGSNYGQAEGSYAATITATAAAL